MSKAAKGQQKWKRKMGLKIILSRVLKPHTLAEISVDIPALEQKTKGFPSEISKGDTMRAPQRHIVFCLMHSRAFRSYCGDFPGGGNFLNRQKLAALDELEKSPAPPSLHQRAVVMLDK
ncbi:MAG: hypothetical protein AB1568_04150 [Thermodesulfobacteriota bacterium]